MALFNVLPIELSKLASVVRPPFQLTRWGVLQRSILAVGEIEESKRGGRRGYRQKVPQLTQGVEQGNYIDQEPCVLESEFDYTASLGFLLFCLTRTNHITSGLFFFQSGLRVTRRRL